jgi:hypothetical protein
MLVNWLSLSQTKSSWRAETNRLMLPSDDRSLQADFLDTRRRSLKRREGYEGGLRPYSIGQKCMGIERVTTWRGGVAIST